MTDSAHLDKVAEAIWQANGRHDGLARGAWPYLLLEETAETTQQRYRDMAQAALDALHLTQEWAVAPDFCPEAPYMETHRNHPDPPQPRFLKEPAPKTCRVSRLVSGWLRVDGGDQ